MLVSRISPAPASSMRTAHSTASSPVGVRPPCVNTSQPRAGASGARPRASRASTPHRLPQQPVAARSHLRTATVFELHGTLHQAALLTARHRTLVRRTYGIVQVYPAAHRRHIT